MGFLDGMKIIDKIEYQGDHSELIWRHPNCNIGTKSVLIVHEGQEAIFLLNGQALDLFGPGKHELKTENIPLLSSLVNKYLSGGVNLSSSEVYFINMGDVLNMKWGTPDRVMIQYQGIPFPIGAGGDLSIRVVNSRKLMMKLVGSEALLSKEQFMLMLRGVLNSKIGDYLANAIAELQIDLFELDRHRREFSEALKKELCPDFEEFGVTLGQFNLSRFVLPEDDRKYQDMLRLRGERSNSSFAKDTENILKMKEAEGIKERNVIENDIRRQNAGTANEIKLQSAMTEAEVMAAMELKKAEIELKKAEVAAQAKVLDAQATATKRNLEGYSYQEERSFNLADQLADKQGGNDLVGLGVQVGTMAGIGSSVGNYMGNTMNSALNITATAPGQPAKMAAPEASAVKCAQCGMELPPNAKFCLNCGAKVEQVAENETVCPACGKKTPKGKFCMECGAALVKKCPGCGAEVPPEGKFCLECGMKL
ncbi:MAG: SPFH domain-containing protein [Lachnospiraceae bacterium]|nr:SPFH domain-containing protein [Lachnospiraceae bacterium]